MKKKIRFGIVGLGAITHRFVRGLKLVEDAELYAVASRSFTRAKAYADQYQICCAYGSYEEMLQNKELDAVYIATPNHIHYDYMMLALQHGKHVLCEKPFTLTSEQAKRVFQYAKTHNLLVMEAMKANFLPATAQAKKWITEGRIGELRYMEASYCSRSETDASHRLNIKEQGGGSFYDLGIYPLAFVNYINPCRVMQTASAVVNNCYGVDEFAQLLLIYENQVTASVRSSISVTTRNDCMIYGTKGSIKINDFWKSDRALLTWGEKQEVFEEVHDKSEFKYEIAHFIRLLQQGKTESDIMSEQATVTNMQLLEETINRKEELHERT